MVAYSFDDRKPYMSFDGQMQMTYGTIPALHKQVIRLSFRGLRNREISAALGISEGVVSKILTSPMSRLEMDRLHRAADMKLVSDMQELVPSAIDTLRELMEDDAVDPSVRVRAATAIADRAGYNPVTKVNKSLVVGFLSQDDIKAIKNRAKQVAAITGQLAEPTEVEVIEDAEEIAPDVGGGSREADIEEEVVA